jgi:alkylation response protein AidB-like acyl-CoA dehydrogenase
VQRLVGRQQARPIPASCCPNPSWRWAPIRSSQFLRAWQRKVYEAGYLGMAWPQAYGGGGRPQAYQDIVNAEMARQKTPFVPNTIGLNWAGPLILAIGTEAQKQRFIPGILKRRRHLVPGLLRARPGLRPGQQPDARGARWRRVRDHGSKIWTSLGSYAKYMILLARTNPQEKRYGGLSFFLIPMQAPGIEVRPIKKLTGEYGFTQTFFHEARVPADCLMGREGEGWKIAMMTLTFERGATGGQAGGLSRVSLGINDVIELARQSRRDGRPALEDPFVRDQLARFLIEDQGDRLCTARAQVPALCSERPDAIPLSAKLRTSEYRRRLFQFALSLQGANAVRWVGDDRGRRGRQVAAHVLQLVLLDHRRGHEPDPGQHRRRARARPAQGLTA